MAITDKILSSIQAEVEVLKETLSESAPAAPVATTVAPVATTVAPVATPVASGSGISPLHNLIAAQAQERLDRAPK